MNFLKPVITGVILISCIFNSVTRAQTSQQLADEDVIEVSGDALHFQMRNVCYEGFLFGISGIDTLQSKVFLHGTNWVFNHHATNQEITGIAGHISNYSFIAISTNDTLYSNRYHIYHFDATLVDSSHTYIPDIKAIKESNSAYWVIHKENDFLNVLRFKYGMNSNYIEDTIPLNIDELLFFEHEDFYSLFSHNYHIVGKKNTGELYYFKLNTQSSAIDIEFSLDTIPGDIKFVSGNQHKTFFISQLDSIVYATDFTYADSSFAINQIAIKDSIIDVSLFNSSVYQDSLIAVISPVNDSIKKDTLSTIYLYNYNNWSLIQTYPQTVHAKKIYSFPPSYWRNGSVLLEFEHDSARYLSPLSSSGQPNLNNQYKITDYGVSAYSFSDICISSIDEHTIPKVQIYLYPNPASERVQFVVKNIPSDIENTLLLYDMSGKVIHRQSFYAKEDYTIPVGHLTSGMYILSLQIDGKIYSRKLMVR